MRNSSVRLILMSLVVISSSVMAKGPTRKDRCLSSSKEGKFDPGYCQKLEKTASILEITVHKETKDKGWALICPEFGPEKCIPELDLDRDGKIEKVFLLENRKRRMIGIESTGKPIKYIGKSSDVNFPTLRDEQSFNLKELSAWSVASGSDPFFKDHLDFCGLKTTDKFINAFFSGDYFILAGTPTGFCMVSIGD